MKYLKFLSSLAFNFLVPALEGLKSFAFLVEVTNPRVASRVISKGDKVEFSAKGHDRCGSPEIRMDKFKNL